MKITSLITLLCLWLVSPIFAIENQGTVQDIEVTTVRVVNNRGLETQPKLFWLESDESHGVAFMTFEIKPGFFKNLESLELLLHTADITDAQSEDGFAVIATGHWLGRVEPIDRNQEVTISLDPNGVNTTGPLTLILVPNGPDGVGLLPQAKLRAHYASAPQPDNGLIAEYLFSGNYQDTSGLAHHGTPSGPCEFIEDRFGQANSALRLNGNAKAMVTVPHCDDLNPAHITLSVWVTGNNPKLWARILHKYNHRQKEGYALAFDHTNGSLFFDSFITNKSSFALSSKSKLKSQWQHIVFTFDGQTACFYYNGQLENSRASQEKIKFTQENLVLGNGYDGNNYFPWSGAIDDIRIYNRTLSEQEVQDLFSEKMPPMNGLTDLRDVDAL